MRRASYAVQGFMFFLIIMLLISVFLYKSPADFDFSKITGAGSTTGASIFGLDFMPTEAYGEQACNPPAQGDWIISKKVICKNNVVRVNGNLIFESHGELIFFNARYINTLTGENRAGFFRLAE